MDRVIYRERLRPTDGRLGRHVHHDSRSRAYAYRPAGAVKLRTVRHERHVPVFDQGHLGSCTGNAAVGCMATGQFFATLDRADQEAFPLNEDGAVRCYSLATAADDYAGTYPPDDTGSDGLSVAKVLTTAGLISGYRHAFSLDDALAALMVQPLITGTVWTQDMFDVDRNGIVSPTGAEVGGHEYVVDSFDTATNLVGFTNSWGTGWGWQGRFFMPAEVFGNLLDRQGDVTVFVPATAPPPMPNLPDDPDAVLARALGEWSRSTAWTCHKQRAAVAAWLRAKGL